MIKEDKEKLLKLINHYETKKDEAKRIKDSLFDQGIDGGIVFERVKTREKNFYYMIQNISIILNDCEKEFY